MERSDQPDLCHMLTAGARSQVLSTQDGVRDACLKDGAVIRRDEPGQTKQEYPLLLSEQIGGFMKSSEMDFHLIPWGHAGVI